MDKRIAILDLLSNYAPTDPAEIESREKTLQFIKANPECFEHHFPPGHVTGSALVVDSTLEYVLLNHHKKLDRWLHFGGHSDGHPIVHETALREAMEESGLQSLKYHTNPPQLFDIDAHLIPEKGMMPEHVHYDIRYLLIADKDEPYTVSVESYDLKWVKVSEAHTYNEWPEFSRMIEKVRALRPF